MIYEVSGSYYIGYKLVAVQKINYVLPLTIFFTRLRGKFKFLTRKLNKLKKKFILVGQIPGLKGWQAKCG